MTTGPDAPQPPEQQPDQQPWQSGGQSGAQPGGQPQPPYPQQPGWGQAPPPGYGYQAQPPMRPEDEKLWAIAAHLGPLLLGFIAPLVVWLVFRDRSAYLARQGKEALNFQITLIIALVVSGILTLVLIGILMLLVVGVGSLVLMIMATIKVANLEDYRYPVNIRFIT